MTFKEIKKELKKISRLDLLSATSVGSNNFLVDFVRGLNAKNIIEIGTYNGISTAMLASVADRVYTFDIAYRDVDLVLNLCGVRHKVSVIVGHQDAIDFQLNCIGNKDKAYWNNLFEFDFAFIDGAHNYESTKHDFELVKFTGRVLFHNADWLPVRKFINEIEAQAIGRKGNWAYWNAEHNYQAYK